jgi:hypothetical protein
MSAKFRAKSAKTYADILHLLKDGQTLTALEVQNLLDGASLSHVKAVMLKMFRNNELVITPDVVVSSKNGQSYKVNRYSLPKASKPQKANPFEWRTFVNPDIAGFDYT